MVKVSFDLEVLILELCLLNKILLGKETLLELRL